MNKALDRILKYKRGLLEEFLSECSPSQVELFNKIYPNGVPDEKLEIAIDLCERTVTKKPGRSRKAEAMTLTTDEIKVLQWAALHTRDLDEGTDSESEAEHSLIRKRLLDGCAYITPAGKRALEEVEK